MADERPPTVVPTDERIAAALEGINYDMRALTRRFAPAEQARESRSVWVWLVIGVVLGIVLMEYLDDNPTGSAPRTRRSER